MRREGDLMKKSLFAIEENHEIAKEIYRMVLNGDTSATKRPGQFINIAIEGFYLRRPISVCDWDEDSITILYKTVGEGTIALSKLRKGSSLDILTGLGNGFDLSLSGDTPLLIGGGVGIPPLYGLAKRLIYAGTSVLVILGFGTKEDTMYIDEFKSLGADVTVTTIDGSMGIQGNVTDAMNKMAYSYLYTCGPKGMLKAVYDASSCGGQYSFEERMACGFGACMGCSCQTKTGSKRICREGPVLEREEIIW